MAEERFDNRFRHGKCHFALGYRISEFAGGGAFIVGKKGAYAEARSNGDF